MSADGPAAGTVQVLLAWSLGPQHTDSLPLRLPAGSTALDALRAGDLAARLGSVQLDALALALWGRVVEPHTVLHDGDRLELLRGLQVDPKEARRLRYRRDGIRPRRKSQRRLGRRGSQRRGRWLNGIRW